MLDTHLTKFYQNVTFSYSFNKALLFKIKWLLNPPRKSGISGHKKSTFLVRWRYNPHLKMVKNIMNQLKHGINHDLFKFSSNPYLMLLFRLN